MLPDHFEPRRDQAPDLVRRHLLGHVAGHDPAWLNCPWNSPGALLVAVVSSLAQRSQPEKSKAPISWGFESG